MKPGAFDLRKLRGSLALCALLVGSGAAALAIVEKQKAHARAELTRADERRVKALARLRQLGSEELELRQRAARFEEMRARRIVNEEPRLEWLELMHEVRERHRLFEIDYELSPQQRLDEAPPAGYEFRVSTMKLELPLLHEEDLLRLIGDLQQSAQALLVPRQCHLARAPTPEPPESATGERSEPPPTLQAQCSLQWITVRAPADKGGI